MHNAHITRPASEYYPFQLLTDQLQTDTIFSGLL